HRRGVRRPRARPRRPPPVVRADDAAPSAGAGRPARAGLSGPQDPRPRALPLLKAMRDRELRKFLTRLSALGVAIVVLVVAGAVGFMLTDDLGAWDGFLHALDVVATVGA